MTIASTLQFRAAVRAAATVLRLSLIKQSWTEGADRNSEVRYVGYPLYSMPPADRLVLAAATERLLQNQGLTAKTRISKRGYLRGTAVL